MADRATRSDARAGQHNVAFQWALVVWAGVWAGVWVCVWVCRHPPLATRRVTRGCDSRDNAT